MENEFDSLAEVGAEYRQIRRAKREPVVQYRPRQGKCIECGRTAVSGLSLCEEHGGRR
jgi:hypothetical protein